MPTDFKCKENAIGATYIQTPNSQITIRELLKCNKLGQKKKKSVNYPLISVI